MDKISGVTLIDGKKDQVKIFNLKWSNDATRVKMSNMRINPTVFNLHKRQSFVLKNDITMNSLSLLKYTIVLGIL